MSTVSGINQNSFIALLDGEVQKLANRMTISQLRNSSWSLNVSLVKSVSLMLNLLLVPSKKWPWKMAGLRRDHQQMERATRLSTLIMWCRMLPIWMMTTMQVQLSKTEFQTSMKKFLTWTTRWRIWMHRSRPRLPNQITTISLPKKSSSRRRRKSMRMSGSFACMIYLLRTTFTIERLAYGSRDTRRMATY